MSKKKKKNLENINRYNSEKSPLKPFHWLLQRDWDRMYDTSVFMGLSKDRSSRAISIFEPFTISKWWV